MAVAPLSSSGFPLTPEQLRFLATCYLLLATEVTPHESRLTIQAFNMFLPTGG